MYEDLKERYATFEPYFQVLNMVSDLEKARSWQDKDESIMKFHLRGAMILLDFMINDPKWRSRCRELLRLREVIGSLLFSTEPYGTLEQTIQAAILLDPKAFRMMNTETEKR